MATTATATLNGGPTGGLHATTQQVIHSETEESQQDDTTCRVDSNSSFDSGHEEIQASCASISAGAAGGLEDTSMSHWPAAASAAAAAASQLDTSNVFPEGGKKRRKQSRPVRIPASEAGTAAVDSKQTEQEALGRAVPPSSSFLDYDCESERVGAEESGGDESSEGEVTGGGKEDSQLPLDIATSIRVTQHHHHLHHHSQQQQQHHHHAPLNLSGKSEDEVEGGDNVGKHHHHHPHHHSRHHKSKEDQMEMERGGGGAIAKHKTELGGHGTKDSQRNLNPSFSPALLPLFGSSQFLSFFPNGQPPTSQQQQQQQQQQLGANLQQLPAPTTPPSSGSNNNSNSGNNQSTSLLNPGNTTTGGSGGGVLQNIPPHRIFNPEAYCDLCNKEFCNKYFLKTHKANKHGVYTESPSSGPAGGGGGMPPSQVMAAAAAALSNITTSPGATPFLGVGPASIICPPGSQQQQQQQQQQIQLNSSVPSPQQQATTTSSSSGNLKSREARAADVMMSGQLPKSILPSSLEVKGGSGNSRDSTSSQSTREAFCELCQKEFCNKYFLKRHKAKIHGIPMESLPSRSGGSRSGRQNGAGDSKAGGSSMSGMPSDLELSLEIVAKHMDPAGGGGGSMDEDDGEITHNDSMMMNTSASSPSQEMGIRLRGNHDHSDEQQQQHSDESSKFKLSSLGQMKLPLGLPQLGTNENMCQFCFREFSSKSQLRAHLTKKHRLLLPTFPPFLLPFHGIGTNLFEDGQQQQQHPQSGLGEVSEGFDPSDTMIKDEVDYECNLCGRSFQTVYLLRMHKSYFHPESEDSLTGGGGGGGDGRGGGSRLEDSSDMDSGKNTPVPGIDTNKVSSSSVGLMCESGETEPEAETTSDSDDLRRLQTMIMELNRASSAGTAAAASSSWSPPLDGPNRSPALGSAVMSAADVNLSGASSAGPTMCTICSKEFYSTYFLQQHIQHYHSSNADSKDMVEGVENIKKSSSVELFEGKTSPSSLGLLPATTKERIPKDGGSLASLTEGSSSLSLPPPASFLTPGPKNSSSSATGSGSGGGRDSKSEGSSSGKRPSPSLSRSYCTICHKELCNKYFMRTHMLKMHGISIESSTGLGGVTCDICNKELCSKYFLKVHKQNTHGIVDEGPSPPNPSTPGPVPLPVSGTSGSSEQLLGASALVQSGGTPAATDLAPVLASTVGGGGQGDGQNRYFCHYSEVCPFCGRRFRSSKWLRTHLMSDHGQEGKEKWKSIEKTLHQQSSRKHSKPASGSGTGSSSAGTKSTSKSSKSKSSSGSGVQIGLSNNGSSNNKCALCGFTTQDVEIMKVHLIKEHASQLTGTESTAAAAAAAAASVGLSYQDAQRVVLDPLALLFQKMEDGSNKLYRCAYCPFATTLLVYLYAHERTHTGLANSMSSQHQQQQQQPPAGNNEGTTFQCPLCLHSFPTVDTFQQHLLGHQMSGVLAPFFSPPPSASPPSRLSFQTAAPKSPTNLEQQQQQQPPPMLPAFSSALSMLNGAMTGSGSEGLYWALKSSTTPTTAPMDERPGGDLEGSSRTGRRLLKTEPGINGDENDVEEEEQGSVMAETARRVKSTSMEDDEQHEEENARKGKLARRPPLVQHEEGEDNDENDESLLLSSTHAGDDKCSRKRRKLNRFRCSCCAASFKSRRECFNHIQQKHSRKHSHPQPPQQPKRSFRCRKCKFTTSQYRRLVVHYRVHHGLRRGFQSENWDEEIRARLEGGGGGASWSGGAAVGEDEDDKKNKKRRSGASGDFQGLPQGRAIPQQGVHGGYVMQPFFLCCSSEDEEKQQLSIVKDDDNDLNLKDERMDEEGETSQELVVRESNNKPASSDPGNNASSRTNNNHSSTTTTTTTSSSSSNLLDKVQSGLFVPSLVYLPVREKVSQSVRVSFSLTPTS